MFKEKHVSNFILKNLEKSLEKLCFLRKFEENLDKRWMKGT